MVWTAFGEALPQAVAIAISPIPIVLVILVLVSPRARTSGPAFAVGWAVGLFALTALVYALADGAEVSSDLLGERTRQPLDELKTWLLASSSTIMFVIFTLLAAKMLGSGLALTS